MSKKRKRRNRQETLPRDSHRFGSFVDFDEDDFDLEQEEDLRYAEREAYDEDFDDFEEDERPPFDFDRWRDDLIARNQQRQRMRQRDLKRGALRSSRIPQPVASEEESFEPDGDDDF